MNGQGLINNSNYACIYLCACISCCIHVVKEDMSFWGLGQLIGMTFHISCTWSTERGISAILLMNAIIRIPFLHTSFFVSSSVVNRLPNQQILWYYNLTAFYMYVYLNTNSYEWMDEIVNKWGMDATCTFLLVLV